MKTRTGLFLLAWTVVPAYSSAQSTAANIDVYDLSLSEIVNLEITSATGSLQVTDQAPAIISVITDDDIKLWQYRSVGEALQQIPGIYCINDYVSSNCGVRGVNGGLKGYSKVLKVMINGQPISFRSDTVNYLGPELITMSVIERIEIIRGPASALYGANAFLGVINIITKKDYEEETGNVSLQAQDMGGSTGYFTSAHAGSIKDGHTFLLALSAGNVKRDGLKIPDTIPRNSSFTAGEENSDDDAKPRNAFGQWRYQTNQHDLEVSAHYSRLDTKAEFLDFGRFSETGMPGVNQRISLDNYFVRVNDKYTFHKNFSLKAALAKSWGEPTSNENLDVGLVSSIPVRDFGFNASDYTIELNYLGENNHNLTFGLDYTRDKEDLFEGYMKNRDTGQLVLTTTKQDEKVFRDEGYYIQYTGQTTEKLNLTLNTRLDQHNIYGDNTTYRLGTVYQIRPNLTGKLLFGTSFKAPAAMQLYGQAIFSGDVTGNSDLKSEKAKTVEAQLNWVIRSALSFSINSFITEVKNKVEITSDFESFVSRNQAKQDSWGIESEVRYLNNAHELKGNGSYQETEVESPPFFGSQGDAPSEMYPKLMANLYWQYRMSYKARMGMHWRYVSQRRSTTSNIFLNGSKAYEFSDYNLFNVTYRQSFSSISLNAKINNLFDKDYAEPGFVGVDMPGKPRTFLIGVTYEL